MALAPHFEVLTDAGEKFLRIRKGAYVRPFIDGETITSDWEVLLIAWKWRTHYLYEAVGKAIPALGRWVMDLPLMSWGLCPDRGGSLALTDVEKTTSAFVGYRTTASGNSNGQLLRSAASGYITGDHYRPSCWRRHVENGIQVDTSSYSPFTIGAEFWTWRIAIVSRPTAGFPSQYRIWGAIESSAVLGNVPIDQPIDIFNQWNTELSESLNVSNLRARALTYSWAEAAVQDDFVVDTATHGQLTHMEWGWWHYGYPLDLATILIKQTSAASYA